MASLAEHLASMREALDPTPAAHTQDVVLCICKLRTQKQEGLSLVYSDAEVSMDSTRLSQNKPRSAQLIDHL